MSVHVNNQKGRTFEVRKKQEGKKHSSFVVGRGVGRGCVLPRSIIL